MNRKKSNIAFPIIIGCFGIFFLSCNPKLEEGTIIITEVAGKLPGRDHITGDFWRYIPNSRIVALDPKKQGASPQVLTTGFFSACAPQVSYDGKYMIFSAQKKQNDLWQLWEMDLENLKIRQLTSSDGNCIDPAYLPDGNLVFSKLAAIDKAKSGHALFTCNPDGSGIRQITYNPHTYFASTVLQDGRILTISRQLYPGLKDEKWMVLRPDGSKEELFYQGPKGSGLHSRGRETKNGKIVFIESDNDNRGGGNIISVNYNSPLHSRVNLSSGIKGDFYAVGPLQPGKFLVSYRATDDEAYALYEFDAENKTPGRLVYKNLKYNILESVVVESRERPRKLPSEVDLSGNTGLLLCQDINFTDIHSATGNASTPKAVRIEILGLDALLGKADVEKDGSFYLKVLADTPFRIQTVDENGRVVNGPGSWIYLRPNERRGCVGCHEGHGQVPENRLLLSTQKDPVKIPADLTEIH